jgi:prepilin-type N-terminal cleavage/methylation domain-containing protein
MHVPLAGWDRRGFTIVELLIVIVVIAILAAIATVAYTGLQKRARDTKRIDDIAKIEKAFKLWAADTGGDFTDMNAGSGGGESGWFDTAYTTYPSVKSVLVDAGYLSNDIVDPINKKSPTSDAYAYMITTCSGASSATHRVLLARLENPPESTPSEQVGGVCSGGNFATYTSTYNMNYVKLVSIE